MRDQPRVEIQVPISRVNALIYTKFIGMICGNPSVSIVAILPVDSVFKNSIIFQTPKTPE